MVGAVRLYPVYVQHFCMGKVFLQRGGNVTPIVHQMAHIGADRKTVLQNDVISITEVMIQRLNAYFCEKPVCTAILFKDE